MRFFNSVGAAKLDRTICSSAGGEALIQTMGGKVGMKMGLYAQSKLILIWGSNAIASNLHFWTFAQAAKRAGAKLICIDPRRTETADKCHQHLALMPGTDGALALGLMHELMVNDWLAPAATLTPMRPEPAIIATAPLVMAFIASGVVAPA